MKKPLGTTALSVLLVLILAISTLASHPFTVLKDRDHSAKAFRALLAGPEGSSYEIRRVLVEPPFYNGLPGVTTLIVRQYRSDSQTGPDEVLTKLIMGHIMLVGFRHDARAVIALNLVQSGHELRIKSLREYSPADPAGRDVGPAGSYQYGCISPDGRFAVLVDKDISIVRISDGSTRKLAPEPALTGNEASPTTQMKGEAAGADVSGSYMEMFWDSETSGHLVVRDPAGETVREIPVTVKGVEL